MVLRGGHSVKTQSSRVIWTECISTECGVLPMRRRSHVTYSCSFVVTRKIHKPAPHAAHRSPAFLELSTRAKSGNFFTWNFLPAPALNADDIHA